jgi:hypothetical protein
MFQQKYLFIIIFIAVLSSSYTYAQRFMSDYESLMKYHPKQEPEKIKTPEELDPEEIVVKGNRFGTRSGWLSVGVGNAIPIKNPVINNIAFGASVNFRVHNKTYLKLGYLNASLNGSHLSYVKVGSNVNHLKNNYFIAGIGKRKRDIKYNFSYWGGISYMRGYAQQEEDSSNAFKTISSIGLYAEAEYIFKIFYDFGIGAAAYVNYDFNIPIYGIRASLYFSNSYRGKAKE